MASEPAPILMVEDSVEDFEVMRRGIHRVVDPPPRLVHARTAEAALAALEAGQRLGSWPMLVLLDLNLPGMPGLELLGLLKAHPDWRLVPVVIITGSAQEADVVEAYRLGASGFLVKPVGSISAASLAEIVLGYWQRVILVRPGMSRLQIADGDDD